MSTWDKAASPDPTSNTCPWGTSSPCPGSASSEDDTSQGTAVSILLPCASTARKWTSSLGQGVNPQADLCATHGSCLVVADLQVSLYSTAIRKELIKHISTLKSAYFFPAGLIKDTGCSLRARAGSSPFPDGDIPKRPRLGLAKHLLFLTRNDADVRPCYK